MPLDLVAAISDNRALDYGGFTAAVLMSYTLNLNFFEQIVAPALGKAGCANALILADPDGYAGALQMGAQTVSGAGKHYVCVPLVCPGGGVQHVKLLLMAGPRYGRLLVGSGNLTLHGYGRNLELISHLEYDHAAPDPVAHYALGRVFQFLERLERDGQFSAAASEHMALLRGKAPWLSSEIVQPADFCLWHNRDIPIWGQLLRWRQERGLDAQPLRSLWVISPYYDRDVGALRQITQALAPSDVRLHTGRSSTNLDGSTLVDHWSNQAARLDVFSVDAQERPRPLHAKAVIGIEVSGAWCLSGSANVTRPALTQSWAQGGNLEMVTLQWASDPAAFDDLLDNDLVSACKIDPLEVTACAQEPSERQVCIDVGLHLVELSATGTVLRGRLSGLPPAGTCEVTLELLRARVELPIMVDAAGTFVLSLPRPLQDADAARVRVGDLCTPYRWIDQPEELVRFGSRSYHARVQSQLESFDGTGKLFEELLNFLMERVDPAAITAQGGTAESIRSRPKNGAQGSSEKDTVLPAPPAEEFVTDEQLVETLGRHLSSQNPYDRSTWSLRSLLVLVLLRLTTPTAEPDILTESGEIDEVELEKRTQGKEDQRIAALERLRRYVLSYCRRYGTRLVDAQFVRQIGPHLLFTNHFVLGRVLLDLANKVELFTREDLQHCFWWTWAPLVWPKIVGLDGPPALDTLAKAHSSSELTQAWHEACLSSLTALALSRVLDGPPSWEIGVRRPDQVGVLMIARAWIDHVKRRLGKDIFGLDAQALREARDLDELSALGAMPDEPSPAWQKDLEDRFQAVAAYLYPAMERLWPLILFSQLDLRGQSQSDKAQRALKLVAQAGLATELAAYQRTRVPIVPARQGGEHFVCPQCHLRLIIRLEQAMLHGDLVLCSCSNDAWLFHRPEMPRCVI